MIFETSFSFSRIKLLIDDNECLKKTFRYYNSRNELCLNNHVYHFILNNPEPVGYGHLDYDQDKLWLGMCVFDKYIGLGYGKTILNQLINNAKQDIHLTVDKSNIAAINLYLKNGFKIYNQTKTIYFCINKYV